MVELISKKQQQRHSRPTLPDLRNVAFHDMVIANKLFEERRVYIDNFFILYFIHK